MNSLLEIHDSTLGSITSVGRNLVLRFVPAYVHRPLGRPGIDPGSSWTQDLDLILFEAIVESSPLKLPCSLSDGSFSIGETRLDNLIPLPLTASDRVKFIAVTTNNENLIVCSAGASVVPRGDLGYVDEYPGSTTT